MGEGYEDGYDNHVNIKGNQLNKAYEIYIALLIF